MDRLMKTHTARTGLLLALGTLLLAGCPLFRDPASPPFLDRVEAVRSLTEYGVVPDGDSPEMRVVNTGTKEFLLLNARTEDGIELLVLNSDLSLAGRSPEPDGIDTAFPLGYDAGFVVGGRRFDGDGEIVTAAPTVFGSTPLADNDEAAIGAASEIVPFGISTISNTDIRVGPIYDEISDFQSPASDTFYGPILLEPSEIEGDPPDPRPDFTMPSFMVVPAADEADSVARLVLKSQQEYWQGELSFSDISQVLATVPGNPIVIDGSSYDFLLDLPTFTRLQGVEADTGFVVTPDVVLATGFERHQVFSRESGESVAERFVPRDEYVRYAYSPSGEHLYMLDLTRWRVYRVSPWW